MSNSPSRSTRKGEWIALAAILVAAAACRWAAIRNDFWLDEIWSYNLARNAHSVVDIFFSPALKEDNNHHLNTLALYLMGDQAPRWFLYRIPQTIAGLVTIGVAFALGRVRRPIEGLISALILAGSFFMIVYSTEARGYGFMLCFVAFAFWALRGYLEAPSWSSGAVFALCMMLALASQATAVYFYCGATLWSGFRLRGRFRDLVRLFALPCVATLAWAIFVLRGSRVGGGPPWTWHVLGDQAFAWTFNYPIGVVPALVVVLVGALIVVVDAVLLWREGSDEGLFLIGVIFGPPTLVAAMNPPWLFPRYFLVSLFFLILSVGRSLARLVAVPWGRPAIAVLAALFAAGGIRHVVPFALHGRGLASKAVADIATQSVRAPARVGGLGVALWTRLPVDFYAKAADLGPRVIYSEPPNEKNSNNLDELDWLVVPTIDGAHSELPPGFSDRLDLRGDYAAYGPSGLWWRVYAVRR